MRFVLEASSPGPVAERHREFVECKGLGHPDTICDALVEAVANELVRTYQHHLGYTAHFNVDKALLAAGQCDKRFLGGRMRQPMQFFLGDRASFIVGDRLVPVQEAIESALSSWLQEHLPRVRLGHELQLRSVLAPGSAPLRSIYEAEPSPSANDTSGAVGFAPFTPTERMTLRVMQYLNSAEFKREFPDTGQDVKVFTVRTGRCLELTIAMPFFCDAIDCEATYFRRKDEVLHTLEQVFAEPDLDLRMTLNALDKRGRGADGLYLTLTGTSAEDADSGQVGRGNRACGFIAFTRPVGGEAAPGKNPMAHVGKIYTAASQRLAERIHRAVPTLREVYVFLAGRIGEPLHAPWVTVQVVLPQGLELADVEQPVRELVAAELEQLPMFCQQLARGEIRVY